MLCEMLLISVKLLLSFLSLIKSEHFTGQENFLIFFIFK